MSRRAKPSGNRFILVTFFVLVCVITVVKHFRDFFIFTYASSTASPLQSGNAYFNQHTAKILIILAGNVNEPILLSHINQVNVSLM